MKLITSIKHQAVLIFASFAIGLSVLFAGLAIVTAFIVEDEMIYRFLAKEAQYIEFMHRQTGEIPRARNEYSMVYENQDALPEFARKALQQGISDNEIFTPNNDHFHIVALELGGETGYLLAEVSGFLIVSKAPGIFSIFIIGGFVTLVIAIVLAYKLASLTVKPVMAMTEAVQSNAPLPSLRYELGYLSATMQQAFDDLSQALKREKDFATDVSHELRTPLTVLSNLVTLTEQRGHKPEDLAQLKQVAGQMHHTIEVLLMLARVQQLGTQTCVVKPMIEQLVMNYAFAQNIQVEANIEMDQSFTLKANATLLNLLFTNLINNAFAHGVDNKLNVTASAGKIEFNNLHKGEALSETMLSADSGDSPINSRQTIVAEGAKSASSEGIGQGLYLVTRILESLGWRFTIKQSATDFSVTIFP